MRRAGPVLDLVAVILFVGIGRDVHARGVSVGGMASTAWPFLSGLALGWALLVAGRLAGWPVAGGLAVCASTGAVGMALRVVSGQGTAVAFVLVALGFLGAAMVGWRVVLAGLRRVRSPARLP